MTDTDVNRSNNTGAGAKALDDHATRQSGGSGGDLALEIGARDEEKNSAEGPEEGRDPQVTSVRKGDKPGDGDEPNLPNRQGGGKLDHAPPRRT
jgi:hypothetical protein